MPSSSLFPSSANQQIFNEAVSQNNSVKRFVQPEIKTEPSSSKFDVFSPNTSNKQMMGNQSYESTVYLCSNGGTTTTTSLSTITTTLASSHNTTLTKSTSDPMQFSTNSATFVDQNPPNDSTVKLENGTLQVSFVIFQEFHVTIYIMSKFVIKFFIEKKNIYIYIYIYIYIFFWQGINFLQPYCGDTQINFLQPYCGDTLFLKITMIVCPF